MGGKFTKIFGASPLNALMLGLDAAGKTTILYKLNLGEVITSIPTIGFNIQQVQTKKGSFDVWNLGGRSMGTLLGRYYYKDKNAIIWVVDSNDRDRIGESKEQLIRVLLEDLLQNTILLVFANKQDLPQKMSVEEVTDKLGLNSLTNRIWHIQGCCATTGEGLFEGFNWLLDTLKNKNQ